jgi:hypothetical protein
VTRATIACSWSMATLISTTSLKVVELRGRFVFLCFFVFLPGLLLTLDAGSVLLGKGDLMSTSIRYLQVALPSRTSLVVDDMQRRHITSGRRFAKDLLMTSCSST